MPQDKVRGNTRIIIRIDELNEAYTEFIYPIDSINTSSGCFQDCLERMIDNAKYKSISCTVEKY